MNTLGAGGQNGNGQAQIRCIQCGTLNPPDAQTCVTCMSSLAASRRATLIGAEDAPKATPALHPDEANPRGGRVSLDASLLNGEMPRNPSRLARLGNDPALSAIPDWYGDLRDSASANTDLRKNATSKGLTDPLTEADAETAMPDWLADLTQKRDDPASATGSEIEAATSDVSADSDSDEAALPPFLAQQATTNEPTDDDLPDWLSNLSPAPEPQTAAPNDSARTPDAPADSSPDWMQPDSATEPEPDWSRSYEGRADSELVFDDALDLDPFDASAAPLPPDSSLLTVHDPLAVSIEQLDASALSLPAWLQPDLPPRETRPDLLPLPDADPATFVADASAPPDLSFSAALDESDPLDLPPAAFGDEGDTLNGLKPFSTDESNDDNFLASLTFEPPEPPRTGSISSELGALPPLNFEIPSLDDLPDTADAGPSLDFAALPPLNEAQEVPDEGRLWGGGVAPWLHGLYPPSLIETEKDFIDTFGDLSLLGLPDFAALPQMEKPIEHSVDIFMPAKTDDLLPPDVASFDSLDAEAFARFEEHTAASFLPPLPDTLDDETQTPPLPFTEVDLAARRGGTSPFSLSEAIETYTDDDEIVATPVEAAAPEAPALAVFGEESDDTDMPEWLRAMRPGAKSGQSTAAPATPASYSPMGTGGGAVFEDDNVPSWLRDTMPPRADDLTTPIGQAASLMPVPPPVSPPRENVPPVVATPPVQSNVPPAIGGAEESADELPPWLQAVAPASVVQPVAPAPEPDSALLALPDWLDEYTADDSPAVPSQAAPQSDMSLDNLFRSLALESATPSPVTDAANLPGWLSGQQPAEEVADASVPELLTPTDLPDWLRADPDTAIDDAAVAADIREEASRPETPHAEAAPALDFNALTADFTDDRPWFARVADNTVPSTVQSATGAGESPDWLSLVRTRAADVDVIAPNPVPPSVRVVDDVPPEPVVLPPRIAGADILRELADPTETEARVAATAAASEATAATARRAFRVDKSQVIRWAIAAAIIAVILLALLLRPFGTNAPAPTPTTQSFYTALNGLPKGQARVLVVYDWDVDKMAELATAARAITQHLMHRAAHIITVSTIPQGGALAASITDPIATSTDPAFGNNYVYSDQYLHLGYRPAGDIAVRGLNGADGITNYFGNAKDYTGMRDVAAAGALKGVKSLSDFDMVVVLAGDDTALRTWVTQYGTQPAANYVVALPAASAPTALPILNAAVAQPKGALIGLNGVAEYAGLLKTDNIDALPDQPLDGRLSAQALTALLLIVLLVGANIIYATRRRQR